MATEPSKAGRLGFLDPLRGILALCVAVYHLSVWFDLTQSGSGQNMALAKLGNYGVSAFFVLSGFLLFRTASWARIQKEGVWKFWFRRFLRLAPVFYLACALNVAFHLGMGPDPTPRFLLENLTLTFGAFHPNHALVTGGWYVGLVSLLYFAYPALAWLREKGRPRGGLVFLAALAVGLWLWSLPSTLHGVMDQERWNQFHTYVLAPNQLFLLAWGGLLAGLHATTHERLDPKLALLIALPLLWLLLRPTPQFFDHLVALTGWLRYRYLLIITILVALAAFTRDGEPGWFGKALTRLGAWSYGLYLLHPFTMKLVAPHVSGRLGFSLSLGFAILAAAAVHRWIEEPAGRLGKG
ncbi:MAG: acyltransferase [Geothrix sp.]|uniref:acyltransferase family protein n=1 Tax=Geothrix sp. TaxID=1962974 RepID=UPI001805FA77|nr:acyltransferase [Geothrix sp.]NWJ41614.1 acyltransferase [Geothrix sp.]WIL20404.1 MAG: acyltransferase [Geothrix sp.]